MMVSHPESGDRSFILVVFTWQVPQATEHSLLDLVISSPAAELAWHSMHSSMIRLRQMAQYSTSKSQLHWQTAWNRRSSTKGTEEETEEEEEEAEEAAAVAVAVRGSDGTEEEEEDDISRESNEHRSRVR